jgi:hypothetical protein
MLILLLNVFLVYVFCLGIYLVYCFFSNKLVVWIYNFVLVVVRFRFCKTPTEFFLLEDQSSLPKPWRHAHREERDWEHFQHGHRREREDKRQHQG